MDDVREIVRDYAERAQVREDALVRLTAFRRRRVRARRAKGAVLTLGLAAGALTWALAGLGRLDRPAESPTPPPVTQDPRLQTATAQGITITYPKDWWLVELTGELQRPESERWPILQLTNYDVPVETLRLCPYSRESMPDDGVLVYVERVNSTGDGRIAGSYWPVDPETATLAEGPCGEGYSLWWDAEGRRFVSMLFFGSDITQADREDAYAAFRSMSFEYVHLQDEIHESLENRKGRPLPDDPDSRESILDMLALAKSPKLVLRSGIGPGGFGYTLSAVPDPEERWDGAGPALFWQGLDEPNFGSLPIPGAEQGPILAAQRWHSGETTLAWGGVSVSATAVQIRTLEGHSQSAELIPLPTSWDPPFHAFRILAEHPSRAELVAVAADGTVIAALPLQRPSTGGPIPGTHSVGVGAITESVVLSEGTAQGHAWRFEGVLTDRGSGFRLDVDPGATNTSLVDNALPWVCPGNELGIALETGNPVMASYGPVPEEVGALTLSYGEPNTTADVRRQVTVETFALPAEWKADFRVYIALIEGDLGIDIDVEAARALDGHVYPTDALCPGG